MRKSHEDNNYYFQKIQAMGLKHKGELSILKHYNGKSFRLVVMRLNLSLESKDGHEIHENFFSPGRDYRRKHYVEISVRPGECEITNA